MRNILIVMLIFISSQAQQKFINIGNFELENGRIIHDCVIGYRTFGQPNSDSSNVVINLTWFEGRSSHLETLLKKYKFIDTVKYYVIAIDALGDGISTSPSNYGLPDPYDFPQFSIRDMINSQYVLLHDSLGFEKIHGAVGGSMGAMQVLEWSAAYPGYIDKIFAYVGTPRVSSFDLLIMNSHLNLIRTCNEHDIPETKIKPMLDMFFNQLAYSPQYRNKSTKREDFDSFFDRFFVISEDEFRVPDFYFQMDAMRRHDISKSYNYSMDSAAAAIKADIFLLVSENDLLVNPAESIEFAGKSGSKLKIISNDCGHLAPGCQMDSTVKLIELHLAGQSE